MNKLILSLSILAIPALLFAATITNEPTGDGLWSTPANWMGGVAPQNGDSVVLLPISGYAPTNVDIADLALNNLTFLTNGVPSDATGLTLIGNDFKFNNIICIRTIAPQVTNVIKQNVYMTKNQGWTVNSNARLIFQGVLGATNDTYAVQASGNGYIQLMNTNTFAGGLQQNQAEASFFQDANVGRVPAVFKANYFQSGYGQYRVFSTAGYNKVVIHPNRGMYTTGAGIRIHDNCKVIYNGQITGGNLNFNPNMSGSCGILVLGGSNLFAGNFAAAGTGGLLIMDSDNALGTSNLVGSGVGVSIYSGIDLNGHNLLNRDIKTDNGSGYNATGSGMVRNTDTNHASTINGTWRNGGTAGIMFGGRGDIIYTGAIIERNPIRKVGSGTLTLKGANLFTNETAVRAGTLVYDYTSDNGTKVAGTNRHLYVRNAAVNFIGNDSAPTTERILDLRSDEINVAQGASALKITAGNNQDFTLAARSLVVPQGDSMDITLENTGSGVAAFTNAMGSGVIGGHVTSGKYTWATIDGGIVAGLGDASFETDFTTSTTNSHMDIAGAISINSAAANTLRAANAGATALTIASGQTLQLANASGKYAGLLVTPGAGSVDIHGGTIVVGNNNWLSIHNYSANRVTIGSLIGSTNPNVLKCGPGELVLTNAANGFNTLGLYGGTLVVDALTNNGVVSAIGKAQLYLGNATLKYIGTGHATDRTIVLRGNGTIEASGTGPLTFTTNRNFVVQAGGVADMDLTLSGSGEGSIAGMMMLSAGCLVKAGSGTWTIGGVCSNYETSVNAGTLCLTGTLMSYNLASVNPGGTLSGGGTVLRELAISGNVAPGTSVGALNVGCLTMQPGCVYEWEVDGGSAAADTIAVAGSFELPEAANSVTVKVVQVGGPVAGAYPLMTFAMMTGSTNALVVDAAGTGYSQASLNITDTGITVGLVPEPALLVLAPLALLALRRRM